MILTLAAALAGCRDGLVYETDAYSWYGDRITEGGFTARALSPTELTSDYVSPGQSRQTAEVNFKFAVNGIDNEMPSGSDHRVYVQGAAAGAVPEIKFGELTLLASGPGGSHMGVGVPVTFRVDMSDMAAAFERDGYYVTRNGDRIESGDFRGVWIAGSCPPLTWDFDELPGRDDLKMEDAGNGIYQITLVMNPAKAGTGGGENRWTMSKTDPQYPRYLSEYQMENALYNLALEESINAVEPDSTLRTGREWSGVWTRDVSYSIILSMAQLQPEVSKKSLMRKVDRLGRIIQDTGTGGAWPVSSDRMIWAVAAWEIYKVTGDRDWLQTVYPIICRSVEDDLLTVFDHRTGLARGESSFLDWREQEYPVWMQSADIYMSQTLGTSAVHYQTMKILAETARIMENEEEVRKYGDLAYQICKGINDRLWLEDNGYYAQFLYGRNNLAVSPRSETLGEALCILWDIADEQQAKAIIANVANQPYGTACFFPNISCQPPYHNDGVWPFVQAYWMWASAKAANEKSVLHSIGSIYRAAAMFLTNKENFVVSDGDWSGTEINSSNMLWSLAGNISVVHHVLFGLRYGVEGLSFEPFVPSKMKGMRRLENFQYRGAVLDITLTGCGNRIKSFTLDGVECPPFISGDLEGEHTIVIELANNALNGGGMKLAANRYSPDTPVCTLSDGMLVWNDVEGAATYSVLYNGTEAARMTETRYEPDAQGEYQVVALAADGVGSFASEPVRFYDVEIVREAEDFTALSGLPYGGYSGNGFVEVSTSANRQIEIPVAVEKPGMYAIDWRYANGNGPINTRSSCAIRTLTVDGQRQGVHVFPHRGTGNWNDWGYTNPVLVRLEAGEHVVGLEFRPENNNMDIEINGAMIDHMRLTLTK